MVEQVSKSEFKAKALELFRRIEATGETLVISHHGRPRLEIRPFTYPSDGGETSDEIFAPLRGSILYYEDPLEPAGVEDWEALK